MSIDISTIGLIFAFGSLSVSFLIYKLLKINLYAKTAVAILRMSLQLILAGLYLTIFFKLNSALLNTSYIIVMIIVANFSLLKNSGLKINLFLYTFPALLLSVMLVLLYYAFLVFQLGSLEDARYIIPITGMLLGNSMNRVIITMERFYSSLRGDIDGYISSISMGASVHEAILPYLKNSYKAGLSPAIANIGTMGLVFLPGMMTGQILGGSSPLLAIKYQIVIMLGILTATELSTVSTIFLSLRRGFNSYGYLRDDIFSDREKSQMT